MRLNTSQNRSGVHRPLSRGLRAQRGAAAIEAALLFVIFFALFYAIVSYSLPLMMMQGFQHAASTGARSAVAVDHTEFNGTAGHDYIENGVKPRVRSVVGDSLAWLSPAASSAVLGGVGNPKVQVDFVQATGILTVTVKFPSYTSNPLIPILSLPGIGDVPKLPQDLTGSAAVQL